MTYLYRIMNTILQALRKKKGNSTYSQAVAPHSFMSCPGKQGCKRNREKREQPEDPREIRKYVTQWRSLLISAGFSVLNLLKTVMTIAKPTTSTVAPTTIDMKTNVSPRSLCIPV